MREGVGEDDGDRRADARERRPDRVEVEGVAVRVGGGGGVGGGVREVRRADDVDDAGGGEGGAPVCPAEGSAGRAVRREDEGAAELSRDGRLIGGVERLARRLSSALIPALVMNTS